MHNSIALLVIVAPLPASRIPRCLIWPSIYRPDPCKTGLKLVWDTVERYQVRGPARPPSYLQP